MRMTAQTSLATFGVGPTGEAPAIRLRDVSKVYRLYSRPHDMMLDQTGLNKLMFWRKGGASFTNFNALSHVNLDIAKGERVGIIGRNGAGKTTLLKLITENFAPTTGNVAINGTVQALMQLGIGFHPDFSGYENIRGALNYNGLTGAAFKAALEDVIDFVELGDFLHQPMKTYSLGMNARVQFAAATAIHPDILIIDEVLGAGDAYFAAKSAHRMERLARSGCTLLLVSHATSQILQFCERAIFMHQGAVRMDGPALEVVKAYEEYIADETHREKLAQREYDEAARQVAVAGSKATVPDLETPEFQKEQLAELLVSPADATVVAASVESSAATETISRWAAEKGLKIARVEVFNDKGLASNTVLSGQKCAIEVEVVAEEDGDFSFQIVILIMTLTGVGLVRTLSKPFTAKLKEGERRAVRLCFDELLITNGDFVFSAALFKHFDPNDTSTAVRYDLLSRSFTLKVLPVHRSESGLVAHPHRWDYTDAPPNGL